MSPLHIVLLVLSTFLASTVEMVEALTIVLAVGVTRGWRPVAIGTVGAFVALGGLVAVLGPAVDRIPLNSLRLVVGGLLLVFGLQWLRKAILRAGGLKALHDEDAIYNEELHRLQAAGGGHGRVDWYGVTVAFKGVFLEGLEVVFIVLTFGATQGHTGAAALAAVTALVLVAAVGVAVHRPLTRVPENTLKFTVGVMLTSFGLFWSAEGAGAHWPGNDLFILAIVAITALVACSTVAVLRSADAARLRALGS
jgi:uncharacterized membrane protein